MKKITLIKDLPGVPAGTEGEYCPTEDRYYFKNLSNHFSYSSGYVIDFPDFFRIEDVPEYFEGEYDFTYYYKKYHTLNYVQQLADHLNGDWKYEAGKPYKTLCIDNDDDDDLKEDNKHYTMSLDIKFNPSTFTIKKFKEKCKPEMLENYIAIMKGEL